MHSACPLHVLPLIHHARANDLTQALYKEKNGKDDQDYVTEGEFVAAFTKGIKVRAAHRD